MKSKYKIGEIVNLLNTKNTNLSVVNLLGLSMNKDFRPSTSNINGTDLSVYKIVKQNQFAVDFMSAIRVHKMPVALNKTGSDIIVSPAYAVFEVKDENIILTDYLMLWFMRPEFDRYADFRSDSAIRGGYDWDELCNTDIEIPSIDEQRRIIHIFDVINGRIELLKNINRELYASMLLSFEHLEKTEKKHLYQLTINENGVKTGKGPKDMKDFLENEFNIPVIGASGIMGYTNQILCQKRIVSTGRVGTIGKVMIWEGNNWFTDNSLMIETEYIATVFCLLKTFNFDEILGGSSNPKITQTDLNNLVFDIPSISSIKEFENKQKIIIDKIFQNDKEISILDTLKNHLLLNMCREDKNASV